MAVLTQLPVPTPETEYVVVVVGENAHVQIVERHQSLNDNPVLTNSVTEMK